MRCALCSGRLVKTTKPILAVCLGVKLKLFGLERSRCVSCKEEFFNPRQAAEYSRVAKRQYSLQTSLKGADIARIRKKLNLSQAELEKKIGLGSKVVVRWENSKVRLPGPVNALFKLLEKNPRLLKLL